MLFCESDTCGDFFFLYVLQLASERVRRENESARTLGSNVFTDWHVWGCGTVFFVTFPGVRTVIFWDRLLCYEKKSRLWRFIKKIISLRMFLQKGMESDFDPWACSRVQDLWVGFFIYVPFKYFFWRDDRMTLAEGLVDDFSILVFFLKFTAVGVTVVSPCFAEVTDVVVFRLLDHVVRFGGSTWGPHDWVFNLVVAEHLNKGLEKKRFCGEGFHVVGLFHVWVGDLS